MKFKKAVVINIDKSYLPSTAWKKIDSLSSDVVHLPKDSPKQTSQLKDADCLLVSFGLPVTKQMIDSAPKLKYIGIIATAFGKVDVVQALKKKITVTNLAGYSTESVAEFTIAALLEVMRGLEEGKRRGRAGNVSEMGISAFELKNTTFGVIGLGSIGSRVAEIALGFGANVVYYSRNRKQSAEKKGIKYLPLDILIKTSRIISLNLAQTKETEKILDSKRFSALQKGVIVINTAPMELVEFSALTKRLAKKDITFILDHSDEMSEKDLKTLMKYDNCIIYPPMAYISREAAENKQNIFLANIENFLKGEPSNVVS